MTDSIISKMRNGFSGSEFQKYGYTRKLMDTLKETGYSIYDVVYISPDLVIAKFSVHHEFPIKGFQGIEIGKVVSLIIEELETLILLGAIERPNYFQIPDLLSDFGKYKGTYHATIKNTPYYEKYKKF